MEYTTKKYVNDEDGIKMKNLEASAMSKEGWKIQSENIEAGKFNGSKACCYYLICFPLVFFAGSKKGFIIDRKSVV